MSDNRRNKNLEQKQQPAPGPVGDLAECIGSLQVNPDHQLVEKGPKRVSDQQPPSKSEAQMHKTASTGTNSTVGISAAASTMHQLTNGISPMISAGPAWSPDQYVLQQVPQQVPQDPPELDYQFFEDFLVNYSSQSSGNTALSSNSTTTVTMMPPPSAPQPLPQPQVSVVSSAIAGGVPSSSVGGKYNGPPVSPQTMRALKVMLNRTGNQAQVIVDENFNTPLHNAVLQKRSSDDLDYLLAELKRQKQLLITINLLNSSGHTPLSLCLKNRLPDLIPRLLAYDAAPTQLCGIASDRTNHFHYAMFKCLDNLETLQVVRTLINHVYRHCLTDLSGLLAKNRHGKTAMDSLSHRISQLSSNQDPASVELLKQLLALQDWLSGQLKTLSC